MSLSVGIDFGTSNSGVAIYDGKQVQILPIDQQNVQPEVIKSILYITKDFKTYIGQEAVALYYKHNVNRQRHFVKVWAGEIDFRGADMHYVRDIYVYVDELKPGRLLQFIKTALRTPGYLGTQIFERYYTLADLIAAYLSALKQRAERLLGDDIGHVTLGRPVKFCAEAADDQKAEDTLREAAYQAGFKAVDFAFEPAAAALYYEQSLPEPQNALIFDFGGGTLDLTIMRLGERGPKAQGGERQIYANGGIGIAGSDFDRAIIQTRLLPHFGQGKITHHPEIHELIQAVAGWMALPDLSTPLVRGYLEQAVRERKAPVQMKALQALIFNDLAFSFYNAVEAAKIALSSQGATTIQLKEKDLNLWELYTRVQFEADIRDHYQQIENILLETVAASGLEPEQIDVVVKTGGSSSIPLFSDMLGRVFGAERVKESNTFSSVTGGLAIKAYYAEKYP